VANQKVMRASGFSGSETGKRGEGRKSGKRKDGEKVYGE